MKVLKVLVLFNVQTVVGQLNPDLEMKTKKDAHGAPSFQCSNPLFRPHWYSYHNDAATLVQSPLAFTDLTLCKMWNYHASCCSSGMEGPQKSGFSNRRARLTQKVVILRSYLRTLVSLRDSD